MEYVSVCVNVCAGGAGGKERLVRLRELLAVIQREFVY